MWLQMVSHVHMNMEASAAWAIQSISIKVRKLLWKEAHLMSWKVEHCWRSASTITIHSGNSSTWHCFIQLLQAQQLQAGRGSVWLRSQERNEGGEKKIPETKNPVLKGRRDQRGNRGRENATEIPRGKHFWPQVLSPTEVEVSQQTLEDWDEERPQHELFF